MTALSPKQLAALKEMEDDPSLEDLFFGKVTDPIFFPVLKERGYFDASKAPGPEIVDDKGSIRIPYWNVLDYLEAVSGKLDSKRELVEIIKAVSARRDDQGKHIDNFHTWRSFVRIVSSMPNEAVDDEIINCIPTWLESRYDDSVVGAEICELLIPKFLFEPNPADETKAEKIIEFLLDTRESREHAGIDHALQTRFSSHWLTELFVSNKNAERVRESCSENIIRIVANSLLKVLLTESVRHHDFVAGEKTYRLELRAQSPSTLRCRIGKVRTEGITDEMRHVETLGLRQFEIDWLPDLVLEGVADGATFVKRLREMAARHDEFAAVLRSLHDSEALALYEYVFLDHSYIWYASLAEVKRFHGSAREVMVLILIQLLLGYSQRQSEKASQILDEFLSGVFVFPVFRRIAVYLLGDNWSVPEFGVVREKIFGDSLPWMLSDVYYEPELYRLLEMHASSLSAVEQESLLAAIETGPIDARADTTPTQIDYWRQRWYCALRKIRLCSTRYSELKERTGTDTEPSFQIRSMQGHGKAPLEVETIINMPAGELAEYLARFRGGNVWKGPTVNALAEQLQAAFAAAPEQMIAKLEHFEAKKLSYLYASYLLWGLRDSAKQGRLFDWNSVLSFLSRYLAEDSFWTDALTNQDDSYKAGHGWVLGEIGNLMSDTIFENPAVFPEEAVSASMGLLETIIRRYSPTGDMANTSPLDRALNSTTGKIVTALAALSWKKAAMDKDKHDNKLVWDSKLKAQYESCLEKRWLDAYTILGWRFPLFYALDSSWVSAKCNDFVELPDEQWRPFILGYLVGNADRHNNFKDLYLLMIRHYGRALDTTFAEPHGERSLVCHIALEYIYDFLPEERSIYIALLKQWCQLRIRILIDQFWMNRGPWELSLQQRLPASEGGRGEFPNKVLRFWGILYGHYEELRANGRLGAEESKLLAHAARLTVFLPRIDAVNFQWLLQVAPHVVSEGNSMFFVEYLNLLKDISTDKAETAAYLARLYDCMLERNLPQYDMSDVLDTINFIYESGDLATKQTADKIVNAYYKIRRDPRIIELYKRHG